MTLMQQQAYYTAFLELRDGMELRIRFPDFDLTVDMVAGEDAQHTARWKLQEHIATLASVPAPMPPATARAMAGPHCILAFGVIVTVPPAKKDNVVRLFPHPR